MFYLNFSFTIDIVTQSSNRQFLILSDSLSCLQAIKNRNLQNPLILEILEKLHEKLLSGYDITFVWVPSHIGIAGNMAADATAKAAVRLAVSNSPIPYSDLKPLISGYVNKCWQESWNTQTNNKLYKIQPVIKPIVLRHLPRRDEIIIHRLRVGHTHLTHSYLLHKEPSPECNNCHLPLTVEHILISCSIHTMVRKKHFDVGSLEELFKNVRPHVIIAFVKEIGLYHKL